MRSGDAMTHPLTEVVKEAPMGTVLIQFDTKRVPRVHTRYLSRWSHMRTRAQRGEQKTGRVLMSYALTCA